MAGGVANRNAPCRGARPPSGEAGLCAGRGRALFRVAARSSPGGRGAPDGAGGQKRARPGAGAGAARRALVLGGQGVSESNKVAAL